jgi:3',5'-cyclic AMP phosphodiesterase CpdA
MPKKSSRRNKSGNEIDQGNKNAPYRLSTLNATNHGGQMPDKKQDLIDQNLQDLNNDGVDRRETVSTPIVLFAHIPLWTIYPDWGWGTDDCDQALSYVKRFGSVTVLNGHIHQIMQKVEGKVSFHTAMSTAFPQPAPGTAASAGPMKVPAEQLQQVLGMTDVNYMVSRRSLAVVD